MKPGVRVACAAILLLAMQLGLCAAKLDGANEVQWRGRDHGDRGHLRFYELLMINSAGVQPTCGDVQDSCGDGQSCCPAEGVSCSLPFDALAGQTICCKAGNEPCSADADCCSTHCQANSTCGPPPCFSGNTLVRVEGQAQLVPIKNVRTGQRVQCMRTTDDMRVPLDATYCEVMNWYHAESLTFTQRRVSFTRPNGAKGSLTLSTNHMMVKLASATPGQTAASFDAFGAFTTLGAGRLRSGDVIAVLTDLNDASKGLTATRVEAVEAVEAEGMFSPGIDFPYIIADGVVAPVWNINRDPVANVPAGSGGSDVAFKHMKVAPVFMVRMQPIDTAGVDSVWPGGRATWPGTLQINKAAKPHVDAGYAYDFTAMSAWFKKRFAEWRADASAGVTTDEMVALMESDGIWTAPDARTVRHADRSIDEL